VSHLNPFFYMIDGFRYGFFGVSDVSPGSAWHRRHGIAGGERHRRHLLRIGYKIRDEPTS